MAKTFESYERLRDENAATHRKLDDRIEGAVELTELLQDVRRRVQAFVDAYEELNEDYLKSAQALRDRPEKTDRQEIMAANIERDYQEIYTQRHPGVADVTAIALDDLKILLDKFPPAGLLTSPVPSRQHLEHR
jgi:uncharacterized protein YyaL (SSP411 family)